MAETVKRRKLTDFFPDAKNANRGTPRGLKMLEDSLRKNGAGRSILVDKHGNVIAGNKTLEQAVDIGLTDALVVPTDGKQLVVVQRVDVDLDTKVGREMAIADNRVGEVNLDFDPEVLASLAAAYDMPLTDWWQPGELAALIRTNTEYVGTGGETEAGSFGGEHGERAGYPIPIVLNRAQLDKWEWVKTRLGIQDDTAAFCKLIEVS